MSLSRKSNGVLYVSILVQSSHNPTFVHTRIENYLSTVEVSWPDWFYLHINLFAFGYLLILKSVCGSVQELLNDLPEDDFSRSKESLSIKLSEKPKGQSEQAAVFRSEIKNQYYNFNRAKIEVEELRSITKSDIIDFYNVRRTYSAII